MVVLSQNSVIYSFFHSFICSANMCSPSLRKPEMKCDKTSALSPVHRCLRFWRAPKDKQILRILASKINKDTWSYALKWHFGCNFDSTGYENQLSQPGHRLTPGTGFLLLGSLRPPLPLGPKPLTHPTPFPNILQPHCHLSPQYSPS